MKDFDQEEFLNDLTQAVLKKSFEGKPVRYEDTGPLFPKHVIEKFKRHSEKYAKEVEEFRQKPIQEMEQIAGELICKHMEKVIEQPISEELQQTARKVLRNHGINVFLPTLRDEKIK